MSKVFISGVAGFLGSHVADEMLSLGHYVVGIDNMIGGDRSNVNPEIEFYLVDCNDFDTVAALMEGCELVYHCAALAYEGLSVFSPHVVTQNIVGASVGVFSAAIAAGVRRIVTCSSMARYGGIKPPFYEGALPQPQDPYGIGKLAVEKILANLCATHGVEHVIAVPHNIIGPRQKYDDPFRNVASIMINRLLQGKPVVIYGDGNQQRCFSYIDDCLNCLVKMAFGPYDKEIINIGPDEETITINQLAYKIMDLMGVYYVPIRMPGRPQEVRTALCSSDKARRLLDYKTQTTLDVGLAHMIGFIKDRGPKPFKYHLPIEIVSPKTPATWTQRIF